MSLQQFLQRSSATEAFRAGVAQFLGSGRPNEHVRFESYAPPVKVERTLTKLLEAYPDLPIERVDLQASSGCEFFRGHLVAHTADAAKRIRFHWDCRWKALQLGWTDHFGFPDQTRAAMEYGYDCFRSWEEEGAPEPARA